MGDMSEEAPVLCSVDGAVATVVLNRPDSLNSLTPEMGRLLVETLREVDARSDIRAAVLTGAGRGFCSGADLRVLAQGAQALDRFATDPVLGTLPATMAGMRIPLVAAVNGPSAGVGFVLALLADVRFAAPTATFASAFSRIGLTAEYGSAWLLPRLVGMSRATEILLSGRPVDAAEAERIGLAHAVADDVVEAATQWATAVATGCSPTSLAAIKDQLRAASATTFADAESASRTLMTDSFRWPDLPEALLARSEKRSPQFPPLA